MQEDEKKSMIAPKQLQTCRHPIYAKMLVQESARRSGCFLPANFM